MASSSGISSSSMFRLSGLASGMDTDSMVSSLMKVEKMPLDKLKQKRQLVQWKQEAYRDITSQLSKFNKDFLDVLSSTNMKSQSTYKKFTVAATNSSGTLSQTVSAIASSSASAGSHKISVKNMAVAESISSSSSVSGDVVASGDVDWSKIQGKNFILNIDGTNKEIKISADTDSASKLQAIIDSSVGSGKIQVDMLADRLTFKTVSGSGVNNISVGEGDSDALFNMGFNNQYASFSNRINPYESLGNLANKFGKSFSFDLGGFINLQINGKTFAFSSTTSLNSMMSQINSDTSIDVQMQYDDINDSIKFTSKKTGSGNNLNITEIGSSFLNAINISSNVKGENNLVSASSLDYSGSKAKSMVVKIDGVAKTISLNSDLSGSSSTDYSNLTAGLKSAIEGAFTGTSVNVSVTNGKINISANSGGRIVSFGDPASGNSLINDLGLKDAFNIGEDAEVVLDGQNLTRSSNSFMVSGITYNVLQEEATPTTQTVSALLDTNTVYDNISKFVSKYNELISNINGKLTEEYDRDYQPLTDDQRDAMSDDDIKAWETKAKTGLLRNDSTLQSIVDKMRTAVYEQVQDVSKNLSKIGITSGSYQEKGKLYIDETKLKDAISKDPNGVMDLFSKESSTFPTVNARTLTSDQRSIRNKEEGIAYRLYDIIQDNISILGDVNGNKGTLLEKAGQVGDSSEIENMMFKEIYDYSKRIVELNKEMITKENAYYSKFTRMEQILQKMSSQSSQLTSSLGKG